MEQNNDFITPLLLNSAPIQSPSSIPNMEMTTPLRDATAKDADIVPLMVERLRSKEQQVSPQNKIDVPISLDNMKSSGKTPLVQLINTPSDALYKVGTGKYVPKYDKYFVGYDNEDLASKKQTTGDRFVNGVLKNSKKAGWYVLGGLGSIPVGIGQMISEGRTSAVFDNDFGDFIDEQTKRLDYKLPNYVSQEERNMSLLRQMGTVNFWSNDVLGGVAFMAGALGSEAIWATVTGGSSLAFAGAKWGAKTGAKALGKVGLELSEKNLLKKIGKEGMNKYLNTINRRSATMGALNNTRFLLTGAGTESAIEARGVMDENLENFYDYYEQNYGRKPTYTEVAQFSKQAAQQANWAFVSNMALVGASNMLQFGRYFDLKFPMLTTMGKKFDGLSNFANKKLFGKGLERAADAAEFTTVKANRFQKNFGRLAYALKNPITEGFEEGMQGVIGKYHEHMLKAKYDPIAMKETGDSIDVLIDAMGETFGTEEGLKEVLIGGIIGKLGEGKSMFKNKYKADIANLERSVANYNTAILSQNSQVTPILKKILTYNQMTSNARTSEEARETGDITGAEIFSDASFFNKAMLDEQLGRGNMTIEDFTTIVNNTDAQFLADELGIEVSEVNEAKQALVDNFKTDLSLYKTARKAASALNPSFKVGEKKTLREQSFEEELAMSFFLGSKASDRAEKLSQDIAEAVGVSGFADMLRTYTNLDKELKAKVVQVKRTTTLKNKAEEEYAQIQQEFSRVADEAKRLPENAQVAAKLSKVKLKADRALERVTKLQKEEADLKAAIGTNPATQNFQFGAWEKGETVSPEYLTEALTELEKLDGFIEQLSKTDAKAAESLKMLIEEYQKNQGAFRSFHNIYNKLADKRYNFKEYKGLSRLFNFNNKKDGEFEVDDAVEQFITDNNLDEYESFNLRLFKEIEKGVRNDPSEVDLDAFLDPISPEAYTNFKRNNIVSDDILNSIVEKLFNKEVLSPREQEIKDSRNDEVQNKLRQLKRTKGDSLIKAKKFRVKPNPTSQSAINTLREMINSILQNTNYLQGLAAQDFNKEDVPTEDEFREINKIQKALDEGKPVSPKRRQRHAELAEKINKWGKIEGTISGKYNLAKLYNQLFALEEQAELLERDVKDGVSAVEVLNAEDIESTEKKRWYNILQTYDKVFFSREGDRVFIHNINIQGFLNELVRGLGEFTLRVNGKPVTDMNKIPDLKSNAILTVQREGGEEIVITLKPGENGTISVSSEGIKNINSLGNIAISVPIVNAKMPSNYFTVMKIVEDGGVQKLVPMSSNFDSGTDISSNTSETQKLKKGDKLSLEVDMQDPYNKSLLKAYTNGEISEEELTRKVKIRTVSQTRNLAGVFKALLSDELLSANPEEHKKMQALRTAITKMVLDNMTWEGTLDLGMEVEVERVFLGHPVLDIQSTPEGFTLTEKAFTDTTTENVVDIGWIEDGKIMLKNSTPENKLTTNYVYGIINDKAGRYKGKRVPIVVFEFNGRKIAYPVKLKSETVDLSPEVDSILASNESDADKAIKLNKLLITNGIKADSFNIIESNILEKAEAVKQALSNLQMHLPLERWMDTDKNIPSILKENATIELDLTGEVFHSPKVTIKLDAAISDSITEEDLVDDMEQTEETEETEEQVEEELIEQKEQTMQPENLGEVAPEVMQVVFPGRTISGITGQPIVIEYVEGEWQQKVGNAYTKISTAMQELAQRTFNANRVSVQGTNINIDIAPEVTEAAQNEQNKDCKN